MRFRGFAEGGKLARVKLKTRWICAGAVFAGFALAYWWIPGFRFWVDHTVSLLGMGDFRALKRFILSFGWWAPAVSAALMILQTLVAPLPAFVLAIANAMAFGALYGAALTAVSALLAAYLAFYLARWLGRPLVEKRIGGRRLDRMLEHHGAWGVLLLRLFPAVSFDFISFAAGLTAMRPLSFGLASLIGMIPAVAAFSLLGESFESASRWTFWGGVLVFVSLLVFAVSFRRTKIWKD